MTKTDENGMFQGVTLFNICTVLKYIIINRISLVSKHMFNTYVKVSSTHFYRKVLIMQYITILARIIVRVYEYIILTSNFVKKDILKYIYNYRCNSTFILICM